MIRFTPSSRSLPSPSVLPPHLRRRRPYSKSAILSVLGALLFIAIAGIGATPTRAAALVPAMTLTVTQLADTNDGSCNSDCSLREAVLAANASPGADTIVVPAGVYNLTLAGVGENAALTGDLDLTGSVSITGAGAGSTIIDGQAADRVFHILAGATVTISGVTVRNGLLADCGGGILNEGTLTLNDSIVSGSQTTSERAGGGICNRSVLSLNRSTVSGNSATYGGGLYNEAGGAAVTVYSSTLSGNQAALGGGLYNKNGTVAMTATLVLGNNAGLGGGIDNFWGGIVKLFGSTVRENTASFQGGGISIESGEVIVNASAILNNSVTSLFDVYGGGIGVGNFGNLTMTDSTISGNSAYADNTCTAAGCSTSYRSYGGGIFAAWYVTLVNTTLNRNSAWYRSASSGYTAGSGAGMYTQSTTRLRNTIIANSRGYNSAETGNCASTWPINSSGHNLDSGYTCGLADPTDKVNTDPLLGPLESFGSAPPVHSLLPGSPAIDAGDNTGCPATDQRGFPRPFDGDGNGTATCDIGAFEVGSYTATFALASSANPSAVGQNVSFTATVSPSAGTPAGIVTFKEGNTVICSAIPLANGQATCTFAFTAPGQHPLTAHYSGDDKFGASTATLSGGQTVNKAATTTTLSAHSPSSSRAGQPVTVNYVVAVQAPGSAPISGSVTVSDGVASCTASAAAGTCTLTLSTVGTRTLTATYAGDGHLVGSASAPVSHVVSPASPSPSPTTSPTAAPSSSSSSFKVFIPMVTR